MRNSGVLHRNESRPLQYFLLAAQLNRRAGVNQNEAGTTLAFIS
jgi:hypothetical protein